MASLHSYEGKLFSLPNIDDVLERDIDTERASPNLSSLSSFRRRSNRNCEFGKTSEGRPIERINEHGYYASILNDPTALPFYEINMKKKNKQTRAKP